MSSSIKEILETFAPFVEDGKLAIWSAGKSKVNEKEMKKVRYDQLADFEDVFAESEILNGLPYSKLQRTAMNNGSANGVQIVEFVKKKSIEAFEKAKATNEQQEYDCVMLPCLHKDEECNWDIVICYITPEGHYKFKRSHTY